MSEDPLHAGHDFDVGPYCGACYFDGLALRRLREACKAQPKAISFVLTFAGEHWYIDTRPPTATYRGATAEAADKCREALEVADPGVSPGVSQAR